MAGRGYPVRLRKENDAYRERSSEVGIQQAIANSLEPAMQEQPKYTPLPGDEPDEITTLFKDDVDEKKAKDEEVYRKIMEWKF